MQIWIYKSKREKSSLFTKWFSKHVFRIILCVTGFNQSCKTRARGRAKRAIENMEVDPSHVLSAKGRCQQENWVEEGSSYRKHKLGREQLR